MKKVSVLVMLFVAVFTRSEGQSMLKVRLKDNTQQITVAVDGRYFNKRGTSITVGDLPYGTHNLKIYAVVYNRRGRGHEELVYNDAVKTYNGMLSTLIFDLATGNRELQETEMGSYVASHSLPVPPPPANTNAEDNTQDNTVYDDNNSSSGPVATPVAMGTLTDEKAQSLKTKVAAKATDTQKMTVLKDELKNEKISTVQVADMMDWFSFEASKLDFAKWAYSITEDKEYYSDLIAKFTYKNYQEDLDKFIKGKP